MHLGLNMTPEPATTTLRCPKCRSRSFNLNEETVAFKVWSVVDGKTDLNDAFSDFDRILGIYCRCAVCGHGWKPRGKSQMPDVFTGRRAALAQQEA